MKEQNSRLMGRHYAAIDGVMPLQYIESKDPHWLLGDIAKRVHRHSKKDRRLDIEKAIQSNKMFLDSVYNDRAKIDLDRYIQVFKPAPLECRAMRCIDKMYTAGLFEVDRYYKEINHILENIISRDYTPIRIPELEHDIEAYLTTSLEYLGGMCLKVALVGRMGFPDRLVALNGQLYLAELKRGRDGRLSPQQEYWIEQFAKCGITVHVLYTSDDIDKFIERIAA